MLSRVRLGFSTIVAALALGTPGAARQAPAPALVPPVVVAPIQPPARLLPSEQASAGATKFSFIVYGDTRSGAEPNVPGDGQIVHPIHNALVDRMLARINSAAASEYPIRFVAQSGDAVLSGQNGAMWNVSFSPIIGRLTAAGMPYFFAVGNHDVGPLPPGDPARERGLQNTLAAMSKLIPPDGSPRRLKGYPTFAFGYGNLFGIVFDSNIATDQVQLAWVTDQLEHLDRRRFTHVLAFFHHPPFSSGQHGGPILEPQTVAIRELYMPLFRKFHVSMTVAGHDHLLDHWVEHYTAAGVTYRMDDLVTGGGGAPTYVYTGEPDLTTYLAQGAGQGVRVDHLVRPGPTTDDNPHHFVVVRVDGDRLWLDVEGLGARTYQPYGEREIELTDRRP